MYFIAEFDCSKHDLHQRQRLGKYAPFQKPEPLLAQNSLAFYRSCWQLIVLPEIYLTHWCQKISLVVYLPTLERIDEDPIIHEQLRYVLSDALHNPGHPCSSLGKMSTQELRRPQIGQRTDTCT